MIWWYNTVVDLNAGRVARLAGNNDWLLICLLGSLRHGYLIRWHRRILDHHALHLISHIAMLATDQGLTRRLLIWHHSLVTWLLGRSGRGRGHRLALRAIVLHCANGPILLAGKRVLAWCAVTRHLLHRLLHVALLLHHRLVDGHRAWRRSGVGWGWHALPRRRHHVASLLRRRRRSLEHHGGRIHGSVGITGLA